MARITETRASLTATIDALAPAPAVSVAALPGALKNTKSVNAAPWVQDNVTTDSGVQYAVWSDDSGHPLVGKRTLPYGEWSTFDLHGVAGNPLSSPTEADGHNTYAIAVDSAGYIHVAGNMHDDALRYVRSTNPRDITTWATAAMVGDETSVTYPQFVRMPNGELLCFLRPGAAGDGYAIINAYDATTQTWARRSKPLSGLTSDGVTPNESPYINHVAVSSAGVIHLFFTWRVTSDVATSHDFCHMKSADNGATFTNQAGAGLTLPVTPATSPVILAGTYPDLAFINQQGAAIDSGGRPHAAFWSMGAGSTYYQQLKHVYHDGAAWQTVNLEARRHYVAPIDMARVSVLSHGDRVLIVYSSDVDRHRRFRVREITPGATDPIPEFTLIDADLGSYEPSFDTRAASERGELHMLITPLQDTSDVGAVGGTEDPAYASKWGAVLSLDLDRLGEAADMSRAVAEASKTRHVETIWLPATAFLASAGSPTLNATASGVPTWALDTTATEVIAAAVGPLPSGWEQVSVSVYWTRMGAGSGDVAINLRYADRAVGEAINGGETNNGDTVVTAPAQYVIKKTDLVSAVQVPPGEVFRLNVRRSVGNAADTLADDMGVFGVLITRTA